MRVPIYRITNDDDPLDYEYPVAVSWTTLVDSGDTQTVLDVAPLARGQSVTVGSGAAVQFTLTRIR